MAAVPYDPKMYASIKESVLKGQGVVCPAKRCASEICREIETRKIDPAFSMDPMMLFNL